MRQREPGFAGLAHIVCGQQVSTASAAAIWGRLSAAFDPFDHHAIRKARTDPEPLPEDPALLATRPEARNLVGILAALSNEGEAAICARFAGQGFGAFKPALTDALVAMLSPLRARLVELRSDAGQIDAILAKGAERAAALAAPTLASAYRAVGLRP